MTKPKIIFMHGNGGESMSDHFFPSVTKKLQEQGHTVIAKDFPDADLARSEYWIPFLMNECGADENSILVGHSSGAIAAMRFAETHTILGSVLIGAYYTDTGSEKERMSGYFDEPWDWEAIRRHQQWIIQFNSVDDPFFSVDEPRLVHEKLQTEYHEFTNRGHFFEKEFPELVKAILKKVSL